MKGGSITMKNERYADTIMRGHFLYWDMLGNLCGIENHKEDNLQWLTGDISHTYFTSNVGVENTAERIKRGEIPANLLFLSDNFDESRTEPFLSSGLFRKSSETIGMAHELCDTALPEPDRRINLLRVREISQLKAAGAILNAVFEYNIFSLDKFMEMFESTRQFFYLAEYEGLPVGAVMSQHGDDYVNISWVGTLPGYRKLGIAGYLIQMAERDGIERGKALGVLHGYPGIVGAYRRLGYEEYSRGTGLEFCG